MTVLEKNNSLIRTIAVMAMVWSCIVPASAQELLAKFTVNRNAVQGTDNAVFEKFKETIEDFVNHKQWTNLHFQEHERIPCNFNDRRFVEQENIQFRDKSRDLYRHDTGKSPGIQ